MLTLAATAFQLIKAEAVRVKLSALDAAIALLFIMCGGVIMLTALGLVTACAFLLLAPAITAPGALGILAAAYLLIGLIFVMIGRQRAHRDH